MSARWTETGTRDWDAVRADMSMPPSSPAPSCPMVLGVALALLAFPAYLLGHVIAWVVS